MRRMEEEELLGWAARAAGYGPVEVDDAGVCYLAGSVGAARVKWMPLRVESDARALSDAIDATVLRFEFGVRVLAPAGEELAIQFERYDAHADPGAAERRALVECAARVGRRCWSEWDAVGCGPCDVRASSEADNVSRADLRGVR